MVLTILQSSETYTLISQPSHLFLSSVSHFKALHNKLTRFTRLKAHHRFSRHILLHIQILNNVARLPDSPSKHKFQTLIQFLFRNPSQFLYMFSKQRLPI